LIDDNEILSFASSILSNFALFEVMKKCALGFSLFELVIVITLFVIFIGLFLQRVLFIQMESEKVAMEMTISNIRTGLQVEVSNMMFEHRTHDFPKLLRKNPILWLNKVPDNYFR